SGGRLRGRGGAQSRDARRVSIPTLGRRGPGGHVGRARDHRRGTRRHARARAVGDHRPLPARRARSGRHPEDPRQRGQGRARPDQARDPDRETTAVVNVKSELFRPVSTKLDLPRTEATILEFWRETNAFEESLKRREGSPPFIFYEGPPTANGLPGVHHVLSRMLKDIVCRYKS